MKVLNESGQTVDLPKKDFMAVGHVYPGAPVKRSGFTRLQCGFWGQAPGPSGYYHAYWWDDEGQQAFFAIGCPHSATHMPNADIAAQALVVARLRSELRTAEGLLATLSEQQEPVPA